MPSITKHANMFEFQENNYVMGDITMEGTLKRFGC